MLKTSFLYGTIRFLSNERNAPINVNPVGGSASKGWGFDAKSISSVGGLIEYLCSGVGTFDLFGRERLGPR